MKSNVLGSATQPNSALFNISQIASILFYGKPNFGVYDSPNSFATMTFNNTLNVFQFSPGQVFYKRNLQPISSQSIPVQSATDTIGTKLFKFYLDYNDFLLSSTVFVFTITAVNKTVITLSSLPPQGYLNNFNTVNINGYVFGITSININTNTVTLNQDSTGIALVGSNITFIFQPVIKTMITFAINGTPPDIDVPSSGMLIASATVNITQSGSSLVYACPLGVVKLFEAYPVYSNPANFFPNQAAYNSFLSSINNSIKAYQNIQSYETETQFINSYLAYTSGISSNLTNFDNYWHGQPYKPTDLFQYGTGFQGLQKIDFDSRFKNFWYYNQNQDLTRTYAIFRGDIYGGNAYVGQSLGGFPGSVSVNNLIDFSGNSTIFNGTYSYGVSAVVASGEYVPLFQSASNFYFGNKVNNYISWTSTTPINNLLFFHVYRNILTGGGYLQQRLSIPFGITSYTLTDTTLTSTSSSLGIGSSNFAFTIQSSSNAGIIGGIAFNAYINDSTPLTGIQSCLIVSPGQNYISPYAVITGTGNGAVISITTSSGGVINSAVITSMGSGYITSPTITIFDASTGSSGSGAVISPILSQLQCGIFTGTSTNPIGTAIATLQSIPIASITSTYTMNMPISGSNFIGLNTNTYYWGVFKMNTPYSLSSNQKLNFINSVGYATAYATSVDGINWTTGISSSQIVKLGYLDQGSNGTLNSSRGVFLTNDKAATPTRLRIYVPNMDLSSLTFNDAQAVGGSSISTALPIQNSMNIYVVAANSITGVQSTVSGILPRGTIRGSSIPLGALGDLYDQVLDVFIVPNISLGVNFVPNTTVINWTVYDLFSIDSMP